MTAESGKFTTEQIEFIDQLGLLTNGYLSSLEELINAHLHSYSSPESILLDIISDPSKLFVKHMDHINDERILNYIKEEVESNDSEMKTTISNSIINLWKDIFSTSYSKYSKEVFDGERIAFAIGVMEQGYGGLFGVLVNKDLRGNGYGELITKELLKVFKTQGCLSSYLQVEVNNINAKSLYTKLGYKEVYQYWYLLKEVNE